MATVTKVKSRTPSFADPELEVPIPLHLPRCPARLDDEGRPGFQRCRCGTATWFLTAGEEVEVVEERGEAVLIRPDGRALVWVESALLSFRRQRPETPPPSQETDLFRLQQYLEKNPRRKWPRRRSRPQGGDLVFVRTEFKAGQRKPLRFLFTQRRGDVVCAVLMDPALSPSQGFRPAWQHLRYEPLKGEPWQHLLVAFPLPDKTESPGWKEVKRVRIARRRSR